MVKPKAKHINSKRGFALATVLVVSCVIIILATSLISVAMFSTKSTSGDVNERQAYLNAKSALNYAATYYENADLPKIIDPKTTGEEYILMKDTVGGTTEEGAEVTSVSADTSAYKTFVHAVYDKAKSEITLRAYAKSEDMLGGNSKSTSLSVTYTVGSSGNVLGRQLSTAPERINTSVSSDDINIHVKQDPSRVDTASDFVPCIYTWSYYKRTDQGIDWNNVKNSEQLTVNQVNAVESENNKFEPAGKWIEDDGKGKNGPTTAMIPEGNAWYSHTFSPSRVADDKGGMVPWFNLIVSRQGGNVGSKADDTQSLEFFNVWYFDESDRNIYVEILESPLKYRKEHDWNGKDLLENRLIAYANSKQTVYYTKLKGINNGSMKPSFTITSTGTSSSGVSNGYGWWSTKIEGNGSQDVTIDFKGYEGNSHSVTVPAVTTGTMVGSIKGNSAYIVIEQDTTGQYSARSFISEKAASVYMNDEDYVTVYAKLKDNTKSGSPSIDYKVESRNSSAAKTNLRSAIVKADSLYQGDYESTSWNDFITIVNAAKEVYNKPTLQSNSDYNAQRDNINNAIDKLTTKDTDPSKLQAKYDKASSYKEEDYTEESYTTLKFVMNQAKELLDKLTVDKKSVSQETADNKAIDLQNKMSTLEKVASYRDNLKKAIDNGKTVRDNNPNSKLINELETALANAENLYNNGSRNKAALQDATKKLISVCSRIQNTGKIDELVDAINAAQAIIDKDRNILVTGTVTNLEKVIAVINNAIDSTLLTQAEIDSYKEKLESAVNELAYIPQDDITPAVADGKKRVWFDIDSNGFGTNGTNYYIYAWYGGGDAGKQNTDFNTFKSTDESIKTEFKLKKDTISKYYYYDLDNKYTNVIIISGVGNDFDQTADIKLGDSLSNNLFMIKSNNNVDSAKLTTIYSSTDVPSGWGISQYVYVKESKNTSLNTKSATSDPMTTLDKTERYYIKRVAFDAKSSFHLCNGKNTTEKLTISTEPVVIRFIDKNDPFKVDARSLASFKKLAPKTNINAMSKNKSADIVNMDKSNTTTQTASYSDDNVSADKPIITVYFKKPSGWSNELYAKLYQVDDNDSVVLEQSSEKLLITDDGNNFYIAVDTRRVNSIIISDKNSSSRKTSKIKFAVDNTASPKAYFNSQQITESGSSWNISSYTASQVVIDTTPITSFDVNDANMAFIGGKKRIFYNKADTRSGRKDMLGHVLEPGKFNGKDAVPGYARVGLSRTQVYYDWYEYKIPAGDSDLYSFQIKGLDNTKASFTTEQVHQVWGDVWVTLDKSNKLSISTVNPEDTVSKNTTRVYITKISDWEANYEGMKVTMWGTGKNTVKLTDTYDGRYYVDIPNNMPFIQLTSGESTPTQILPMTKLQGGDVVLYDYNAGPGGTPAWLTYVPGNLALSRAKTNASSIAEGWYIYDYDYNTHAAKLASPYVPNALKNIAESITSTDDPTKDQELADLLKEWTEAYQNLYYAISSARAYVTIDSNGNPVWYPEQASISSGVTFDPDEIKVIAGTMKDALAAYNSDASTLDDINSYTRELNKLIKEISPDVSGKVVAILDNQNNWTGSIFLRYTIKDNITGSSIVRENIPVTSRNSDGYYMYYINAAESQDNTVYDVQFYTSKYVGSYKDNMQAGQEWVYGNSGDGWVSNSPDNYFTYSSKKYKQTSAGEQKIVGYKSTDVNRKDAFILYFTYDTNVTYSNGSYTILSGAYIISNANYSGEVNLYSDKAKTFFTDTENQGYIKGAKYSDEIGWTDSNFKIKSNNTSSTCADSVNFRAKDGKLNGKYTSDGTLAFRWESQNYLYINNNTTFIADDFVFASSGKVSGGSKINPKFILRSKDSKKPVQITFLTNTTISYKNASGETESFKIYAGTYEARKTGDINIFDKTWNTKFRIVETRVGNGTNTYLSNPRYSSD